MTTNKILIVAFLLFTIASCKNETEPNKDSKNQNSSEPEFSCSVNNKNFDKEFFPFDIQNFSVAQVRPLFDKTTKIDSIQLEYKFYYFQNHPSEFSIRVDSNHVASLDGGHLKTNMFKSKNGIEIGMNRADFFKIINQKDNNCSIYTIVQNSMMYHFKFDKDKLVAIDFDAL